MKPTPYPWAYKAWPASQRLSNGPPTVDNWGSVQDRNDRLCSPRFLNYPAYVAQTVMCPHTAEPLTDVTNQVN